MSNSKVWDALPAEVKEAMTYFLAENCDDAEGQKHGKLLTNTLLGVYRQRAVTPTPAPTTTAPAPEVSARTIVLTINGEDRIVTEGTLLTYRDIATMAGFPAEANPVVSYSHNGIHWKLADYCSVAARPGIRISAGIPTLNG